MIFIVHGDNTSSSRTFLSNLINKPQHAGFTKVEISIKDISPNELADTLNNVDMFAPGRIIVLDISGLGRKNPDEYLKILDKNPAQTVVIIYSNKELGAANAFLKKYKTNIYVFKDQEANLTFALTDAVFAGNRTATYKNLETLIAKGEDLFGITSLLTGTLRNYILEKEGAQSFSKVHPYVQSKIRNSSKSFSSDKLKELYELAYKVDLESKSGLLDPGIGIVLILEQIFLCLPAQKKST